VGCCDVSKRLGKGIALPLISQLRLLGRHLNRWLKWYNPTLEHTYSMGTFSTISARTPVVVITFYRLKFKPIFTRFDDRRGPSNALKPLAKMVKP